MKHIRNLTIWLASLLSCLMNVTTFAQRTATAIPTLVNGFLVAVTVTDGGLGYERPPAVKFAGGGGIGAAAFAIVTNGAVDRIIVSNAGSGYTNSPAVEIEPPPSSTLDLSAGLVLYYPFNGDATDKSGNGHDGTVIGAKLAVDRNGQSNSCYYFNGDTDYIRASSDGLPQTERTVSLWFKAERIDRWTVLMGYGGSYSLAGPSSFCMLLHDNTASTETHYRNADPRAVWAESSFGEPPLNAWHHWVVTMTSSQIKFYWDGVLILHTNAAFRPTYTLGRQLIIGENVSPEGVGPFYDINTSFFSGYIDDVRIYNRALSDEEAAEMFAEESPIIPYVSVEVGTVRVNMHVRQGKIYQLQTSTGNLVWVDSGLPFVASSPLVTQQFDVASGARFFRLVEVP